jgi:hypothetical protein
MNDCQKRGHHKLFITCEECGQVINEATLKEKGGWIDVKDRLPEIKQRGSTQNPCSDEVLCSDGKRCSIGIRWICGTTEYFLPHDRENMDKITHWMPLPEPPK